MKFIVSILAVLVLALSCLPCADDASMLGKAKTESTSATDEQNGDHEDDCSPFCQCSCCAGFSIDHLVAEISYDNNYNNRFYTSFLHSEIIEISLPIWQPPQLV